MLFNPPDKICKKKILLKTMQRGGVACDVSVRTHGDRALQGASL